MIQLCNIILTVDVNMWDVHVTEHRHRFPREAVEPSSLEIFGIHLGMILGNQLQMAVLLSRGVRPDGLHR